MAVYEMALSPKIRAELAPTGVLRVALNHGNRVLVRRDENGVPAGITVDLGQALASEFDLQLDFVHFERAVDVSDAATGDIWDVCFLAVDPKRAETIDFTAPYVGIAGSYLVAADFGAVDSAALVGSGAKVGTVVGSAYTLTLERLPGAENLVRHADIFSLLDAFDAGEIPAIAGIHNVMQAEAALRPGTRILHPPFMEIRQAMAIPRGRAGASATVKDFLRRKVRDGTVADILERNGLSRDCVIVAD